MLHLKSSSTLPGTGFNFLLAGDMPSYIHDGGLLSPTAKERYACAHCKVTNNALEVTPASEKMFNDSLRYSIFDEPVKPCHVGTWKPLSYSGVTETDGTRAAKRMADEAPAATAKEAKLMHLGGARRAWREEIGARVPKSTRVVYAKTGKRVYRVVFKTLSKLRSGHGHSHRVCM